jgi:hypothetical protein
MLPVQLEAFKDTLKYDISSSLFSAIIVPDSDFVIDNEPFWDRNTTSNAQ